MTIYRHDLYKWCSVPTDDLAAHPDLKVPLRLCASPQAMADLMARELVGTVQETARNGSSLRVIIRVAPPGTHPLPLW